ncbi:AMP phosphorylase [Hyperthermus butylicus]|uniref:AMP phosphorylase n=1 Tax=Hyperthermus butylicus (strain DSM 5456 / JCM 9403 / PLM1-5) TaxID=415426 RepID=AMPPA_HYPBU|nr:AMP phosphorylase [Hyperthermus butylicus]A2BJU0.1 RecName: Full=AMP phosphorylase; Short=AMPpase; AltName: Full=Nucleoside monophosphate phosphorylase; Short=NMP phosphorylase [Hyperthermus butylicus DSM 5456]ABM80251.1 Thymidine phosphorylase [Hyperthermus butylicus DSM 5456]
MPVKGLKVEAASIDPGHDAVILNPRDAEHLGVVAGLRASVVCRGRGVGAVVIVDPRVPERVAQLTKGLVERLGDCDTVDVHPIDVPPSFDAFKKRLSGARLSAAEYKMLIADIVAGYYDDAQIASFLVSQLYSKLADEELEHLIRAMVETGEVVKFGEPVYDVHSIGGVPGNSKVALLVVPIVASRGLLIPKTSSRAITSPAGTADTMEVLAKVAFKPQELHDMALRARGLIVWGGALNLAPADDIFVRVERRIGVDPPTQMVASILAKKLAMSVSRLVIDLPTGRGAKVQDESEAELLASMFLAQAGRLNIAMRVAITFGGEPIGFSVGPALEAREALQTLMKGDGASSLVEKACSLAGLVFELGGVVPRGRGYSLACEILRSGAAYRKFREIIEVQEGDPDIKPEDIKLAPKQFTLEAPRDGIVTMIDNRAISLAARAAGAPEDKGAGIQLHVKTGYRVRKGDPLLTIYASSDTRLHEAVRLLDEYNAVLIEGVVVKVLP